MLLDEVFYESLIRHPLPVRETAIRALSGRSMAIDLYIWLAYRLHHLTRPTRVPWPALYRQFGAGFAQPRQFRAHAREALALALAAYPEAQVRADDEAATLMPSPAPVPERLRQAGRGAKQLIAVMGKTGEPPIAQNRPLRLALANA